MAFCRSLIEEVFPDIVLMVSFREAISIAFVDALFVRVLIFASNSFTSVERVFTLVSRFDMALSCVEKLI